MSDDANKRPAHGILEYGSNPIVVFDTVCTKHRSQWLASDEVHQLLVDVWKQSTQWLVGKYVVMPDHIHLFAWATDNSGDYENWVRYWKSQFSKAHQNKSHRWQPDHWDVRLRTPKSYEEKWNYIRENPVRHGLVNDSADWRFQGELFELEWIE